MGLRVVGRVRVAETDRSQTQLPGYTVRSSTEVKVSHGKNHLSVQSQGRSQQDYYRIQSGLDDGTEGEEGLARGF